jgi:ParB-like nuclease domain
VSAWSQLEADRAFAAASRARRRSAMRARLRRSCRGLLPVYDQPLRRRAGAGPSRGVREIPVDEIYATTEPNRAAQFDKNFRPAPVMRCRWLSVWKAEHRGMQLPPILVVRVDDGYALRDGHHRVSVARARGAATIRAVVEAA